MSDFDVERITEFEIENLKDDLKNWIDCNCTECINTYEKEKLYNRLIDVLELRIQQLKDRLKNIANEVTER